MALTSQMNLGSGFGHAVDPETKRLKNERKRVTAYIRQYERDPGSWSKSMLAQLEQLAVQYQIPFKRKLEDASFGSKAVAFGGGIVDSALFDFIPDDWYSDESTRKAANYGKIGGSAAQILAAIGATVATGGMAAPTIGAAAKGLGSAITAGKGISNIAKAAGKLAVTVPARTPLGMATGAAAKGMAQATAPYFAGRGSKWAQNLLTKGVRGDQAAILSQARTRIREGGNIDDIVSGANMSPEQIRLLTAQITRKYGANSNTGKELLSQLSKANQGGDIVIGSMKGLDWSKFANSIHTNLKGSKLSIKNIEKAYARAFPGKTIPSADAQTLFNYLKGKDHTMLSDAISDIVALGAKNVSGGFNKIGLGELDKFAVGTAGLGLGFSTSQPFRSRIKSREELESAFTDPYDPYNQA